MAARSKLVESPVAALRHAAALNWLVEHQSDEPVVVVGHTRDAAAELTRAATARIRNKACFGWHRLTLAELAVALAGPVLCARQLVPIGLLSLEALCARIVHELGSTSGLGRLQAVADMPGLPRALARTLLDLRQAGVRPEALPATHADLRAVQLAYEAELGRGGFADRSEVFRSAAVAVQQGSSLNGPLQGAPLCLLDVAVSSALERDFLAAVVASSPNVLATVPSGDDRSRRYLSEALSTQVEALDEEREQPAHRSLRRLQRGLFCHATTDTTPLCDDVVVLSAPGENREAVEIARRIRSEADRGVAFDRMAIVLRSPNQYRPHLEEALRRAAVPAHFARGTVEPDPAGRALLSLLACAADGLSARRFAEYLSLGEVPNATAEGQPPPPPAAGDRWVAPDEELLSRAFEANTEPEDNGLAETEVETFEDPEAQAVAAGVLRCPRRWERLLVDAAVIGERHRWQQRLSGWARELELDVEALEDPEGPEKDRITQSLKDLAKLSAYALPLIDMLAIAPEGHSWGDWLDYLSTLATRALRQPERVLSVLGELAPMSPIGPMGLSEVRLVLEKRLSELVVPVSGRRYGRVYVAPIEAVRGLSFDVVFVPGLAERLFPKKVSEDPILTDQQRANIHGELETSAERIATERLSLRLCVGAAEKKVVLTYPRVDMEQSRPRVPSFYGLEVLRAAQGTLPGFSNLARQAERVGSARIGWPAPPEREACIDEAEHDLALLERLTGRPENETTGEAHYLLSANPHLARALRFRARRWIRRWTPADGLVQPSEMAREALAKHAFSERSFSPTALQNYATCPYKFLLYAVMKLSPREVPEAIEELNPLQRGSLVHDVLFQLLAELRDAGQLPVTQANLNLARQRLEQVTERVARTYQEQLFPAIDRVFRDGVASVLADLRELLRRAAEDADWTPSRFELSFGLRARRAQDPGSVVEPVALDCGIRLRGSIDLVEEDRLGHLRATDYKTGKVRAQSGTRVGGGETLQPLLYALTLEKLFPGRTVESGRLYYCTSVGGFEEVIMPLDSDARQAAAAVATTIGGALKDGFLPAAPTKNGCTYCDYNIVCGPYEEFRTSKKKPQAELKRLKQLRDMK